MSSFLLLTDHRSSLDRLFPPESGRLHVVDTTIRTESNSLFSWRGLSWFLGFLRYSRGEDILPDIKWMLRNGVNIPRVFGPLPWKELQGSYSYANFNFQKFDSFLGLLGSNGIRCNFCVAPGEPDPNLKSYLNQVYEVISGHWNALTERVNEPDHGLKPDPLEDWDGVNTRGILEAYGYYPEDKGRTLENCPVAHFGTVHLPRDDHWARKARDAQFLQKYYHKPFISDEPAKIAEPGFIGSGVKNDWETTPREASWHFGVCHLWTPGGTIHNQYGRDGLVPEPGSLTQAAVDSVRDNVWLKIGVDVQTGDYMGSHYRTSPVDNVQTPDGKPIWTYSSVFPNDAWSVRCYPSAPFAKNGWVITERWGPSGEFVRLVR